MKTDKIDEFEVSTQFTFVSYQYKDCYISKVHNISKHAFINFKDKIANDFIIKKKIHCVCTTLTADIVHK